MSSSGNDMRADLAVAANNLHHGSYASLNSTGLRIRGSGSESKRDEAPTSHRTDDHDSM